MAIDGEPKDGDFVRYIEMLNRQAGAAPGLVPPRPGRAAGAASRPPTAAPAGSPASAMPAPPAPGATAGDATHRPATLAARSGQRRIALGLTIAGVVALWHAVGMLLAALETRPFQADELIPAVFLAVCAFMLFKGGSRLRAAQRAPLPSLPPLSTLPGNKRRA